MRTVAFPLEYHAEVLGDYQDRTGAERKLLVFALGAAVGIFLLLQAASSSWRVAIVAFLGLLVAGAGGVIAAWIDGGNVTLATVAGMLALLAVAVRQALMLIGRYQSLEREEGRPLDRALVERASCDRLGPIVTSAGTTAVALLPLVILGSIAGQEIVTPLAVVVIGGLISTVLAMLFVLPPLYLRLAPGGRVEQVHADLAAPVAATSARVGSATQPSPTTSDPSPTMEG